MILKTGMNLKKKILALLLTAVMVFSLLPTGLPAADNVGLTLIPSGDYTISADGTYQLATGYSGIITITPSAFGVRVIGSEDGKTHPDTSIKVAERPLPMQLIIEDLKLTAPEGQSGIDFGNAPGTNYDKWPYNQNNIHQPAPYFLANLLRIDGDCSVAGGRGRAGVYVGEGVWLTIDTAPDRTDAQARLDAVGGEMGSGIGGDRGFSGGSVSINGGTIVATGGVQGAGIGGLVGAITINGGTVTSIGGQGGPGIGNELSVSIPSILQRLSPSSELTDEESRALMASLLSLSIPGETIIINGGIVTAVGNNDAGISAMGGIITLQDMMGGTYFSSRKSSLGRLSVNGGSVTSIGSGEAIPGISGRWVEINEGLVSASASDGPGINGVTTTINGGTVIAAGGSTAHEFAKFINDSVTQLKNEITENTQITDEESRAADLLFDSMEQMFNMLFGSNSGGGAGIGLWPGDSLIINNGVVVAQGGPSAAGIGGSVLGGISSLFSMSMDLTPGPITINGGLVVATGGSGGAGIGGGFKQKTERITISGKPTVIATSGSDGAQDIGCGQEGPLIIAPIRDPWGSELSYIRLEVKNKRTGQPLPDKKVTVDGITYFTNKDGLLGFFAPRTTEYLTGGMAYSKAAPSGILVQALDCLDFPGALTRIIPDKQNIRAVIDLDLHLQNINFQGISGDDPNGVILQPFPSFAPRQEAYTLEVANEINKLKVIPERVARDAATAILINGIQVKPGEPALIPLQIGENNILVTLNLPAGEWAAESSYLKKEYLIKVNRTNMSNLPNLTLLESNQPLDEGGTFRARFGLVQPVSVRPVSVQRTTIDSAVSELGTGYGGKAVPILPDNSPAEIWPGPWTGTWRGTVDYGDGSAPQAIELQEDGTFDLAHRYGIGGDYPLKIVLAYEDSGLVTGSLSVKVNYVAPQLLGADIVGDSFEEGGVRVDKYVEINEGDLLILEGAVADPGDNRWIVTMDSHDPMGPLEITLRPDKTFTIEKILYDPPPVRVSRGGFIRQTFQYLDLVVRDNTGLRGARRVKVNVKNVAPSVLAYGAPLVQLGLAFSGAGSFSDPGRDSWQATVDYGDGSGSQPLTLKDDKTFELNHIYRTVGTFTVTVRVEDQDGGVGTASFPVKVKDYIFTLEAGVDTSIKEGEALIRSVPVRGPAAKVHSITVDYGDGSAIGRLALDPVNRSGSQEMGGAAVAVAVQDIPSSYHQYFVIPGYLNLNHTYTDNGKYTVTMKLTDTDGDVYEDSFQAEAANVAPVVNITSNTDIWTNETVICYGSFTDPGKDTWSATMDFGDGRDAKELKLDSDGNFSASHSYNFSGSYTITVTVIDDDGGIGQAVQRVSVRTRGSGISTDANLYSLNVGAPLDTPFDQEDTYYTVGGGIGVTQLTVTAHPQATIRYRITPNPIFTVIPQSTPTIIDILGADLIIEVTAGSGDTKTYTVDNTP